jgi:hypothetical protein
MVPDLEIMILMVLLAADWATISSLATGAGTLVLAIATFAAVRSSNRSARIAEAALQEQRRPLLAPSRLTDPKQKIMFLGGHWVSAEGGRAAVEYVDGIVYLAISLRNVGSGIAVCQGWAAVPGLETSGNLPHPAPLEDFRLQSRDLYVPAGDIGMWQGALRNPDDPVRAEVADAIEARQPVSVQLLYSDQVGRQRTISRFGLTPADGMWLASLNRHWFLDWQGPRSESLANAAAEAIFREQEAATERQAAANGETADGAATDSETAGGTGADGEGADGAAADSETAGSDGAHGEAADSQEPSPGRRH